ncbi:MAG: hypothetical protein DRJ52_05240 [Thermoprotei archaeon]|nr:MAG: hypothetical protein DRJ52_05240 [Thermoprotei archaeon]
MYPPRRPGPPGAPLSRRPPPAARLREEILEEIRREIRTELRLGLARLYRHLRRDIRMAILEAKGLSGTEAKEAAEKEEKEEDEQSIIEKLFGGFNIDVGDLMKYGGAALAGALAVLLITHIDDIYNFINEKKSSGASVEEIKEALAQFIQEKLSGSQ